MKSGDVVKRNGNFFIVKKDNHNHYYLALLLGGARITAWHRTPLNKIKAHYRKVENYEYFSSKSN